MAVALVLSHGSRQVCSGQPALPGRTEMMLPHSPFVCMACMQRRASHSISLRFIQVRVHTVPVGSLLIGLPDPGGIPTHVELSWPIYAPARGSASRRTTNQESQTLAHTRTTSYADSLIRGLSHMRNESSLGRVVIYSNSMLSCFTGSALEYRIATLARAKIQRGRKIEKETENRPVDAESFLA